MWTGVFVGTLGAVSAERWPTIWLIIEVNLISFITLITKQWSNKKTGILYFIVQSLGSLLILRGGLLTEVSDILVKCVALGILLKMRSAPFHFWGGQLVTKLPPLTTCIFLTWQKIAPLLLLILTTPKFLINFIIIINALVSSSHSIGRKNVYLLIFFSGLLHICWLLSAPSVLACVYFLLYLLSSVPIFFVGINLNLTILLLSLAGLPPITGFCIKLIVLPFLRLGFCCYLLGLSAVILYAYLRAFLRTVSKGRLRIWVVLVCSIGCLF